MKIAIVPGHGWRPHPTEPGQVRWDPGAAYDDLSEAVVVRSLAGIITGSTTPDRQPGPIVECDARGPRGPGLLYRERHAEALRALGPEGGLILHLHANAGGGHYPAVFHDPRSRRGAAAARSMASAIDLAARLSPSLAGLTPCKFFAATRPEWNRVANLVEPTWAAPANVCSILVEVGFIDQPDHEGVWTRAGLEALAKAIASQAG